MGKLRYISIGGIQAPPGTPIKYEGEVIGYVVRNNDIGFSECAINSDTANHLISTHNVSFSLEVIKK